MSIRKQILVACCVTLLGLFQSAYRATAQTLQQGTAAQFTAPGPQGSSIVGTDCHQEAEQAAACTVRLQQNGTQSSWRVPDTVFVAWAKNGESFVLETLSSEVYIGKVKGEQQPIALPYKYTTPTISANGNTIIAVKLGTGQSIHEQLENSEGLALVDVHTDKELIVGPQGAFAPFFITDTIIGYGHLDERGLASLYTLNTQSGLSTKLTNRKSQQATPDPFPEEPPIYDAQTDRLLFVTTENEVRGFFRVSLSGSIPKHETMIKPDDVKLIFSPELTPELKSQIPDITFSSQISELSKATKTTALAAVSAAGTAVLFRLPFDPKYYQGVYNFMDHNGQDWNCGTKTYSGHTGTDFKLDIGTPILAAAPGVPYYTVDGCPDTGSWTSTCGSGYGNHVRLLHSDGRVSIYGHMKKGSVIAGSSTATVACGNAIGLSGDSGKSTAPHVHFEIWQTTSIGIRIDPFLGRCNPTSKSGEWISQTNAYPSGLVGSSCQAGSNNGDFSVYAPVFTQTVSQGSRATYTVQIQSLNGFNGVTRLQALNLPSGYDPSTTVMSPEFVTPAVNGSAYALLTVGTTTNTATGRFLLTIQGSSGSLVHSTQVELIINRVVTASPPTIGSYSLSKTPVAGQPFNVTVSGGNFVVGGTRAFFCITGSTTCYEQPSAGVSVSNASSLTLNNVNLGSGSWQFYLLTNAGQSGRSGSFTVAAAPSPPTIGSYSFSKTPVAGQPFNVTVSGSNFVVGGTRAFFCITGSTTCYEQPSAGVSVSNASGLTLNNVNLGSGSWRFYLLTSAGQSPRVAAFSVR